MRASGCRPGSDEQIRLLLEALAAEPDPHTTVSEPEEALRRHVADSLSGLEVEALVARAADRRRGRRARASRAWRWRSRCPARRWT